MRAIRYHRYSSKKQDRGSSLERQDQATRELCERLGFAVEPPIQDLGQSAWKGDHLSIGNLGKFKALVDAGLVERGTAFVVENLDRLSRQDYRTARNWIEEVTDAGIVVYVARPELRLDREAMSGTNIGAMLQHLLEANRARSESDRKSEFQRRNVERMREQARAGIVFSKNSAAWLTGKTGERFRVIEERAAVVVQIYEWCAAGQGLDTITQRLNATVPAWTPAGYKTGRVEWRRGYVRDILQSKIVEGEYHPRDADRQTTGEVIHGYYPRIVSEELVEQARAAMTMRKGRGGRDHREAKNIFNGLLKCQSCGGAVGRHASGRKGTAYYKCRHQQAGTCDNRIAVNCDVFETAVLDQVLHLALDDTCFVIADDVAPLAARAARLRKQREQLEFEQANLLTVLAKVPDSSTAMAAFEAKEAALKAVVEEATTVAAALDRARGQVSVEEHASRVRDLRQAMHSEDREEREEARRRIRGALAGLIERVTITGDSAWVVLRGDALAFGVRAGAVFGRMMGLNDVERARLARGMSATEWKDTLAALHSRRAAEVAEWEGLAIDATGLVFG